MCIFISVTATELKMNLGKYLMLAETEDVFITKNGKVIAKLDRQVNYRYILYSSQKSAQ